MDRTVMSRTVLVAAITLLTIAQVQGAAFIKFEGVEGESTDAQHRGWSDLISYSLDLGPSSDPSHASVRRGQASSWQGEFVVTKHVDKASPFLMMDSCPSEPIPTVLVNIAKDAGEERVYLSYELKNVLVSSYQVNGSSQQHPTEQISLNFEEIKVTYSERGADGSVVGEHVGMCVA